MLIASIVGARPNFVKLAPVSRAIREFHDEIIIHTGQHYDYQMDRLFFDELKIPEPDYHLNVGSGSHGWQTGEMLGGIEGILLKERPDIVVVYGDTNSTLAGALAAVKLHQRVLHVEAGLRSYDMRMPEEVNRVSVDHISDLLSCPTRTAVSNLAREGITEGVHLTGDVMMDILLECLSIAQERSDIIDRLGLEEKGYYLATVHRAENTDDSRRLGSIIEALSEIGEELIFPCHPRTEKMLRKSGLWQGLDERIRIIPPVGYLEMLVLEAGAAKVLTDSGGVQKEAYMLQVPCITLRDTTEWVETIEDGWNVLVGASKNAILDAARNFEPTGEQRQVFGEGDAGRRIAALTLSDNDK
ncbi:MAG: UDP-N-acetylglucosamine 2-epimerase (non-hydrolyzing) [Methanotrichaceae archaeon]|nr:UDP-N-acetylglucosamine 2-epimerase (non-hydrolyzing) [Methanotrichaceae archaeon]